MGRKILTKKRIQALGNLRKHIVESLKKLEKKEKKKWVKGLYNRMIKSVLLTPIYFYDSHNLNDGSPDGAFVKVKGMNVTSFSIITQGNRQMIKTHNSIKIPAWHFFRGERITMQGVFTLCHEFGHFHKPESFMLAAKTPLNHEQAEELYADVLAAKVSLSMGFSKSTILSNLHGRQVVYGAFPFMKIILNAMDS